MSKYSHITSLKQLDAAQREVSKNLKKTQKSLSQNFGRAREFYTPSSIATNLVSDFLPIFDWRSLAIFAIRQIKAHISEK